MTLCWLDCVAYITAGTVLQSRRKWTGCSSSPQLSSVKCGQSARKETVKAACFSLAATRAGLGQWSRMCSRVPIERREGSCTASLQEGNRRSSSQLSTIRREKRAPHTRRRGVWWEGRRKELGLQLARMYCHSSANLEEGPRCESTIFVGKIDPRGCEIFQAELYIILGHLLAFYGINGFPISVSKSPMNKKALLYLII